MRSGFILRTRNGRSSAACKRRSRNKREKKQRKQKEKAETQRKKTEAQRQKAEGAEGKDSRVVKNGIKTQRMQILRKNERNLVLSFSFRSEKTFAAAGGGSCKKSVSAGAQSLTEISALRGWKAQAEGWFLWEIFPQRWQKTYKR